MKKPKIMLVEAETDVARPVRAYLEQKGYEVFCAETLQEARACLWEYPPDLILLDASLPDGPGGDFCGEVRRVSAVPIIFLTYLCADADIVDGLERGADDYITKPCSLSVLSARIAAQLRRRSSVTGEIILPPLYISLTSGTVKLNGKEIYLSRKEFHLLLYMVENLGQELSQSQIYEAVWANPPVTMGNTVRVHISRLRRKLRLDDGSAFELLPTANQSYIFLRTL
jgi:DNA-binding response OmpR family regulator